MKILFQFCLLILLGLAGFVLALFFVSQGEPLEWFFSAAPLVSVMMVSAIFILLAFLFGLVTGDYSWVDRLWSTLPIGLGWIYAYRSGWNGAVLIPAVLISLWGFRLSLNFARRGGYSGMEDYRWEILRGKIKHPLLWQLFHFFFICFYQISLFVLFTAPLQVLFAGGVVSSGFIWVSGVFLFFLVYETVADQQQWDFQRHKRGISSKICFSEDEVKQGFCSSGLFRFSRHPNYFGELGVWWAVYLAGAVGSGYWLNWSLAGAAMLTLLFIGSTVFTENITSEKYPEYSRYQKNTSPIIPWFSRYRKL